MSKHMNSEAMPKASSATPSNIIPFPLMIAGSYNAHNRGKTYVASISASEAIGSVLRWAKGGADGDAGSSEPPQHLIVALVHHTDAGCLASEMVLAWLHAKGHLTDQAMSEAMDLALEVTL